MLVPFVESGFGRSDGLGHRAFRLHVGQRDGQSGSQRAVIEPRVKQGDSQSLDGDGMRSVRLRRRKLIPGLVADGSSSGMSSNSCPRTVLQGAPSPVNVLANLADHRLSRASGFADAPVEIEISRRNGQAGSLDFMQ